MPMYGPLAGQDAVPGTDVKVRKVRKGMRGIRHKYKCKFQAAWSAYLCSSKHIDHVLSVPVSLACCVWHPVRVEAQERQGAVTAVRTHFHQLVARPVGSVSCNTENNVEQFGISWPTFTPPSLNYP
eukprot:362507-Chlamydomonas_euryale.AAC.19